MTNIIYLHCWHNPLLNRNTLISLAACEIQDVRRLDEELSDDMARMEAMIKFNQLGSCIKLDQRITDLFRQIRIKVAARNHHQQNAEYYTELASQP